jgi:hypothetical protein
MVIRGQCHCGNIRFALTWEPDPTEIRARRCTCTFCVKHGARWTSNPSGVLEVQVGEHARVSLYQHGTRTADFHVCARCGVVPVVSSSMAGVLYAVVNVDTFLGIAPSLITEAPANYEQEDEESRLARRQRNWIPQVTFKEGVEDL